MATPLTPDSLVATLHGMGIDDTDKLIAFLAPGKVATDLRKAEQSLDELRAAQAAAAGPFNDRIRPIEVERAAALREHDTAIAAKVAEINALKAQL